MFEYTCKPKDLGVFNQLPNFDVLGRSLYYTSMILRLKLPEMDSYPLFELSNTKADFVKASTIYPELKVYFNLLIELQKIAFKCSRLLDSMCLTKTVSGDNFLEIRLVYPKDSVEEISNLLNNFGISPSIIN